MGKTLLRVLLEHDGPPRCKIPYPLGADAGELAAEEAALRSAAIDMLREPLAPAPTAAGDPDREVRCESEGGGAGQGDSTGTYRALLMLVSFFLCTRLVPSRPCAQLWVFGVTVALLMAWDGDYKDASDQLRLLPAQAAEVLEEWSRLCAAWRVRRRCCGAACGRGACECVVVVQGCVEVAAYLTLYEQTSIAAVTACCRLLPTPPPQQTTPPSGGMPPTGAPWQRCTCASLSWRTCRRCRSRTMPRCTRR